MLLFTPLAPVLLFPFGNTAALSQPSETMKKIHLGPHRLNGVAIVVSAPCTWNVSLDCNSTVSTRIYNRIADVTQSISANVIPKKGDRNGWFMCCKSASGAQLNTRGGLLSHLFRQSFAFGAANVGHSTLQEELSLDAIAQSMVGKNHWLCLFVEPGHFLEAAKLFCPEELIEQVKEPVSPLSLGQIFYDSEGRLQFLFDRAHKLILEDEVRRKRP
jgi:hypothetical protein